MSLIAIWEKNPDQLAGYAIRQIVAMAGDGKLRDVGECSSELRSFLSEVDSAALAKFTEECLTDSFENSGLVLQDVVNEIGRRLEFEVENGLYRGKSTAIGFDGIWKSAKAGTLVVEVKTTDLYNVKLDNVAGYRRKLIDEGKIPQDSAVLFIVGRQDTGSLEAQIRGSRHAWAMRVIGADSLLRLMKLKEKSSSSGVINRIQALLQPVEYTRVDGIVDLMFDATADVETASDEGLLQGDSESDAPKAKATAPTSNLEQLRTQAAKSLAQKLGTPLIQQRRASFASADGSTRAVIAVSKRYGGNSEPYWYAYHPSQDDFLSEANQAYFVLGCADSGAAYALPLEFLRSVLPKMGQTSSAERQYWHVKGRPVHGKYHLVLKGELVPIESYRLSR